MTDEEKTKEGVAMTFADWWHWYVYEDDSGPHVRPGAPSAPLAMEVTRG